MVVFKELRQRFSVLEGDDGQEDVAREGQIERGVRFAMAVPVLLPGAGVAFVMVAVFHGPMLAGGVGGAGFLVSIEAGKEEAGVGFLGRQWIAFFGPVTLKGDGRAGTGQPSANWGNGGHGTATRVQPSVLALLTQ